MTTQTVRPHPFFVVADARKWLILLLFPVARFVYITVWGGNAWWVLWQSLQDMALAGTLVLYSVYKRRCTAYTSDGAALLWRRGVWLRQETRLSAEAVTVAVSTVSLAGRMTGGCHLALFRAGRSGKPVFSGYLPRGCLTPEDKQKNATAHLLPVAVLSLAGSALTGGLLTLFSVSRYIRQWHLTYARDPVGDVLKGGTEWPDAIMRVLLLAWVIAVSVILWQYARFRMSRTADSLFCRRGLLCRRTVRVVTGAVTAWETGQTLLLLFFGLRTVRVTVPGYRERSDGRVMVFPAVGAVGWRRLRDGWLPEIGVPVGLSVRPQGRGRYVAAPGGCLLGGWLLMAISPRGGPVPSALLLGGAWWLLFRLIGYYRSDLGGSDAFLRIRGIRALTMFDARIPWNAVEQFTVRQSGRQQENGTCTLTVRCRGARVPYRLWNVNRAAVTACLRRFMAGSSR